jgi:hypothetical protein
MPFKRNLKNVIFTAGVWLAIVVVIYTVLLGVMPPEYALLRAVLLGFMTAIAHYSNAFIFYRTFTKGRVNTYIISAILLVIFLSGLRVLLELYFIPPQLMPGYFHQSAARPHIYIIATALVCAISFALLYAQFLTDKEKLLLQTISKHNEAQLRYLQSHLNPHFLFNTLNNIYSMVVTRSDKAPDSLLMLTDLLRYSVYQKEGGKVPVSREAEQIDLLIKLFSLRRQEPYPITFTQQQISGTIEQMILVPLAENCLKHSDLDLNEQGYVKMTLSSDKEGLLFETENTFDRNQHKESGGGVGLQNMRERLSLIYGDKASLNVQEEDNLFKVQLRLIWKKQ